MSGGAREKDQADFDLERFIEMFDEALTSNDERVINALRSLLMIVTLTAPETRDQAGKGPLRRLFEDVHNLNRRLGSLEESTRQTQYAQMERARIEKERANVWPKDIWDSDKYTLKEEEFKRIAKLINSPSLLPKKEI